MHGPEACLGRSQKAWETQEHIWGGQAARGRLFQELNSGKPEGHTHPCPPRPAYPGQPPGRNRF